MKRTTLILGLLVAACGCQSAATRAWQQSPMPTHDRQLVFDAARDVFAEHFEVTKANFVQGTIETKPRILDRKREGMLADVRGAGGRWRQTASFEMDRDGLTVLARVAVRLEREGTEAARAITEATSDARQDELPRSGRVYERPVARASDEVWTEVGYDASLARELLSAIAERVRGSAGAEEFPEGQSPKDAAEETRRMGAEQGP